MPFVSYQQLREINAFDYLVQYEGFNISTKSNKSWAISGAANGSAVIEHPTTGAKYLVKKDALNSNEYRITSTDGIAIKTGKGDSATFDLLSFIAHLHNQTFNDAAISISKRIPTLAVPIFSQHLIPSKIVNRTDLTSKILANIKPLTNTDYLQKRNISNEIINDDVLFGRMGLYKNKLHDNFCFHCYDDKDRLITTCQRYFIEDKVMKNFPSFKNKETGINHSPSTTGTIFRSNMPDCPSPILLFSESPEDALSYYQLHYQDLKDKTFIASSMGTFRKDQAELLSSICKENLISKIILVNDNDAAGVNFDLMALCAISPTACVDVPILKATCNDKKIDSKLLGLQNKLHYNFKFSEKQFEFADNFNLLLDKDFFSNKNRKTFKNGFLKDEISKNMILDFECKNDKLHVEDIIYILGKADKSNYFNEHFFIDKPNDIKKINEEFKSEMKDWNEFLKHNNGNELLNKKFDKFFNELSGDDKVEKKKTLKM